MNELHLVSDIPPSVNHYLAYRAVIRNGKPMAVSYSTKESVDYKKYFSDYVMHEVENQGWNLPVNKDQHFYVDGVFYFPRKNMDANNYWKILLDAITDTQKIWADDNVVCERVQGIFYDSNNPRIELEIKPVEYIGVFNNTSQLVEFKTNCVGCSRYTRNCSILQSAIDGRVQDEIKDNKCSVYRRSKDVD